MSKKVYVGNLVYEVSDKDLAEMFAPYGEVTEAIVIKDKYSGRSKGFGFVTFANDESATKAISEMNEKDFKGRALKVNEAKPMEESERRPQRSFGGGDRERRPFEGRRY